MSFIREGAEGAVELAIEKIRRNQDEGSFNPRPEIDLKQQKEFLAEARDGRTPDAYKCALERANFVFHPPACRCASCATVLNEEGIWRHERMKAAFTPNDVTTLFLSPEKLVAWIDEQKLVLRLAKRNAPKAEVRKAVAARR